MTSYLHGVSGQYPGLVTLDTAGKSYEMRDIWALTVTDKTTGPHHEKPAIYVDGSIHAVEVAASMICLYLIDHLLNCYGEDDQVTHLLKTRTFYILPRVNPDGVEKYLTTPYMLRSSVRPWPRTTQEHMDLPGLHPDDIDGDGYILNMRLRDDKLGEWMVSKLDPRIMVPRRPGERVGPFYRMFSWCEGMVRDYEGWPFPIHQTPWGIDLNRNFPQSWAPKLPGAADYPGSEPESRTVMDFILNHPNINLLNAVHTAGGLFYRNPYQYQDDRMDTDDLRATREIAREGTRLTGYPDVKSNGRATLPEWAYEQLGIIGYTTEAWDRLGQAGLPFDAFSKADTPVKREELQLKLLQWNDRELMGKGFFTWRPFEHPQLGEVEIGGWNPKFNMANPPLNLLPTECHKVSMWAVRQAAALPELSLGEVQVEQLAEETWKLTATFDNAGYLPSCTSAKGWETKAVKPDVATVEGPIAILGGNPEQEVGYLEGYIHGQGIRPARSTARLSWLLHGLPGAEVQLTYRSQRGGAVRTTVRLGAPQPPDTVG